MDYINNNNSLKNDLKELSVFLGDNLDWVQGAGGNTSVKENGVLWVKASGYWLSDAQNNNIFVPLDKQTVLDKIKQGNEDLNSACTPEKQYHSLRPSIETTMHALMRHRFVVHVHSVNVISYAVLKDSKKILNEKLDGINWLWVPYVRPGLPLAKILYSLNVSNFDVIILANHGVVIGGDTKEEVLDIIEQVETRLFQSMRGGFIDTNKAKLEGLVETSEYRLPKHDFCHSLAKDALSIEILGKNPLYPDHVIFLGPGTIPVMSYEKFKSRLSEESSNLCYKVVVIKGIGVIVNQSLSENGEEMLHCLTNVLLRLHPDDKLQHLTQNQEAELIGWDAEKYRKSIQR